MSCCPYKEFLNDLDYIKNQMNVFGVNYDICQTFYALYNKVKQFFPINKVPEDIVKSLEVLHERLNICVEQTGLICDRIALEIEIKMKLLYPSE